MCCLVFISQAQLEEKEATIADLKSKLERNADEGDNALRQYSTIYSSHLQQWQR